MRLISGCRVFLAFILLFIASVAAAAQDFPLTFGTHETLNSKILGEKQDILVSAPAHPVPGMPLLILLDGEWNLRNVSAAVAHLTANGRLPPTVVAGVVNTDRGRDLMPTFTGDQLADGPSDAFLLFWRMNSYPRLQRNIRWGSIESWRGTRMRECSRCTHLSAAPNSSRPTLR